MSSWFKFLGPLLFARHQTVRDFVGNPFFLGRSSGVLPLGWWILGVLSPWWVFISCAFVEWAHANKLWPVWWTFFVGLGLSKNCNNNVTTMWLIDPFPVNFWFPICRGVTKNYKSYQNTSHVLINYIWSPLIQNGSNLIAHMFISLSLGISTLQSTSN